MVLLGLIFLIVGFVVVAQCWKRFRRPNRNTRRTWRTSGVPLVMTRRQ